MVFPGKGLGIHVDAVGIGGVDDLVADRCFERSVPGFTACVATQNRTIPDTDPMRSVACDWTGEEADVDEKAGT